MSEDELKELIRGLKEAHMCVYSEPTHFAGLYPKGSSVGLSSEFLDPNTWATSDQQIEACCDAMELQMMGIKP